MLFIQIFTLKLCLLLMLNQTNALFSKNLTQSAINFIKHKNKPTKINLLLNCWSTTEIKAFTKELSDINVLSKVYELNLKNTTEKKQTKDEKILFIMDFNCYKNKSIFTPTFNDLFQFPHRWFIWIDNITSFPQLLPLAINSRVYLFQTNKPNILISPYLVQNTTEYNYNHISTWHNLNYELPMLDISEYQHRTNQNGLIINSTGVAVYARTKDHLLDWRHTQEDGISKHNYILLLHLMEIMNTKLNMSWVPSWGTKAVNSTKYNNMMGDLQSKTAEIGGTIGFMTEDRFKFADYVANPVPTVGKFILKSPPLSAINNILTMPFEVDVWVSLLVLTILILVLMVITVNLEWKLYKYDERLTDSLRPNTIDIVQFQIGVVCQQGIEKEPISFSGRLITFCALLSSLFFYTSYSAFVVALLQSSSSSITTLEDLLNTNIKLGVDNMPYAKFFFSRQTGAVKEAIYKQKIIGQNKENNFLPVEVGVEKMRHEFYAFHAERVTIYKQMSKTFQEHEKCGIVEIKYLSEIEPYLAIRKASPYKEIITMAYSKFKEAGLSMRMYKLTYTEKPKCTRSGGSFRSVGINDAYFAVMIYAIGVMAAILIYIIERVFKLIKKQRSNKIH